MHSDLIYQKSWGENAGCTAQLWTLISRSFLFRFTKTLFRKYLSFRNPIGLNTALNRSESLYKIQLYNKALHTYIFVCMLAIAGQTTELDGLKFFEGTLEYPEGNISYTKFEFCFFKIQLVFDNFRTKYFLINSLILNIFSIFSF